MTPKHPSHREEVTEAIARAICIADGYDPDHLEPGDDPYHEEPGYPSPCIDGYNRKDEPCHFFWRHYDKHDRAAMHAARTPDPSTAELVKALQWCVDHEGECLGDHPAKLNAFELLLAEGHAKVVATAIIDAENLEMAKEALKPFAKAGELFGEPVEFDQCIYSPAAGAEYSLSGNDLRRAHATLKIIVSEQG